MWQCKVEHQETLQAAASNFVTAFASPAECRLDMQRCMALPTFADIHTHIDKGHTCERSRNPTGNLSGADRSTASDANFWDSEDVYRR